MSVSARVAAGDKPEGQARWARILRAGTAVLLVFGLTGLGDHVAVAQTSPGFAVRGAVVTSGQVAPGGRVAVEFQVSNGDTVTASPFAASAVTPANTTLVPHSQTCGTTGGTCSESSEGSELLWEIPAGAPTRSTFVFSFEVALSADHPPAAISARLRFSGPGCLVQPFCMYDAPEMPAGEPSIAAGFGLSPSQAPSASPPTTDNQSLQVAVPECKTVGSKPKDKTRLKCRGSTGPGSPAPGKGQSGLAFTSRPSGLASSGASPVRTSEAGLLTIGLGGLLVLVSHHDRRNRRRQGDT